MEKALLLKFMRLDETVIIQQMARVWKESFHQARTFVILPNSLSKFCDFLVPKGSFDEIILYHKKSGLARLKDSLRLISRLRAEKFNLVGIFYDDRIGQGHLKLEALALLAGAQRIVSCDITGKIFKESKTGIALRLIVKLIALLFISGVSFLAGIIIFLVILITDLFSVFQGLSAKRQPEETKRVGENLRNISAIIPNKDGKELLRECLPAVIKGLRKVKGEHEIIVVDDASSDNSVNFVRSNFPRVKLICLDRPVGFGKACNIGIANSQNEVILLLNTDVIVDENFLLPLLEVLSDPKVFAVGSSMVGVLGDADNPFYVFPEEPKEKKILPNLGAPAGCGAFSKAKLKQLGGFDPIFYPFYWEENDLGFRAWKRGWKVYFDYRSFVWHKHGSTISKLHSKDYIRKMFYKNKFLFVWKNIRDKKLLLLHFLSYPFKFSEDILINGRCIYSSAFFLALHQLPQVLRARVKENQEAKIRNGHLIELLKNPYLFYYL